MTQMWLWIICYALVLVGFAKASWLFGSERSEFPEEYGVDVTFPIHRQIDRSKYAFYSDRYRKLMQGCYNKYDAPECDSYEHDRLEMNLNQPATQHNYTEIGFKHMRLPPMLWDMIREYYAKHKDRETVENWPRGNTYVNHWDSPTYMVSVEDRQGLRGGKSLRQQIWDGLKPILEEWTGQKLESTSLYGIRVYKNGAVLAPHVDRLPLVSSAIIQVDQSVNEPWPIEVYDHAGKAHNVTMKPGDLVLYESHTVIHGRPFPMNGNHYANIFVHFQPIGHNANNDLDHAAQLRHVDPETLKNTGGHENHVLPRPEIHDAFRRSYDSPLKRMQEELANAQVEKANGVEPPKPVQNIMDHAALVSKMPKKKALFDAALPTEDQGRLGKLRVIAAKGDLATMQTMLEDSRNIELLEYEDKNKWRVLHEAIRGGNVELVKLVVSKLSEVNSVLGNGKTALWLSKALNPEGHAITDFLVSAGAVDV